MGTRGLTVVVMDGEHRVAQYGQWDHYPKGQGAAALAFCCEHLGTPEGRNRFKAAVDKCRYLTNAEYDQLWTEIGVDVNANDGLISMDKSDEFCTKFPAMHRNTGAEILKRVLDGDTGLQDSLEFGTGDGRGFACEGIYLVNLDADTLEIYYGSQIPDNHGGAMHALHPKESIAVPLVARFDLKGLPPLSAAPSIMERLQKMVNLTSYPECREADDKDVPLITGKSPREVAKMAMGLAPEATYGYCEAATQRVQATIAAEGSCYDPGNVPYLNVQDMLTDLRHYCDSEGLDFAKLSATSCSRHKGQAKMDARVANK